MTYREQLLRMLTTEAEYREKIGDQKVANMLRDLIKEMR